MRCVEWTPPRRRRAGQVATKVTVLALPAFAQTVRALAAVATPPLSATVLMETQPLAPLTTATHTSCGMLVYSMVKLLPLPSTVTVPPHLLVAVSLAPTTSVPGNARAGI